MPSKVGKKDTPLTLMVMFISSPALMMVHGIALGVLEISLLQAGGRGSASHATTNIRTATPTLQPLRLPPFYCWSAVSQLHS